MEIFKEERTDAIRFLALLYRNQKTILLSVASSLVLSIFITGLIPSRFYSYGIIFPSNSNSLEEVVDKPDFGFDLQADRLMQILESETIRDSIVRAFDLKTYYEVDTSELDWKFKLDKKFTRDITFFRSKYMSIVISAETRSPELSAEIVNRIIDMVDGVRTKIFKENFQTEMNSIQKQYFDLVNLTNHLRDSIEYLSATNSSLRFLYYRIKYGIGNGFTEEEIRSELSAGALNTVLPMDERLITTYLTELNRHNELKVKYDRIKIKVEQPFPAVYTINRAQPSYRKVFPSYRINAIIAFSFTLIVSILIIWFREKYSGFREQIIKS